jgi:hypothetical protein
MGGIGEEAGHRIVDDWLVVDRTRTHGRRDLAPALAGCFNRNHARNHARQTVLSLHVAAPAIQKGRTACSSVLGNHALTTLTAHSQYLRQLRYNKSDQEPSISHSMFFIRATTADRPARLQPLIGHGRIPRDLLQAHVATQQSPWRWLRVLRAVASGLYGPLGTQLSGNPAVFAPRLSLSFKVLLVSGRPLVTRYLKWTGPAFNAACRLAGDTAEQ